MQYTMLQWQLEEEEDLVIGILFHVDDAVLLAFTKQSVIAIKSTNTSL